MRGPKVTTLKEGSLDVTLINSALLVPPFDYLTPDTFRYIFGFRWFWGQYASRCCLVESGLTSECDDEHNKAHAHMRIL